MNVRGSIITNIEKNLVWDEGRERDPSQHSKVIMVPMHACGYSICSE